MRRSGGTILAALAGAALFAAAATTARADLDVRDQIGFGGRWVVGAPTPYTLTLSNSGAAPIEVLVRVSTGASFGLHDFVHARTLRIDAGGVRDEVFLLDGPQAWEGAVHVEIEVAPTVPIRNNDEMTDRGSMTFDRPRGSYGEAPAIEFPTHVVGVCNDPRAILAAGVSRAGLSPGSPNRPIASSGMAVVGVPDALLRFAPLALEGIDELVLCDPDARTCAEPAALEGVLDWVALGGTLVVSPGEHAAEFAASPLAAHLPARWTGAQRRKLAEVFEELRVAAEVVDAEGPWTELRLASGEAEKHGDGPRGPHRVERKIGMGRVVVLAYDARALLALAPTGALADGAIGRMLAVEEPPEIKQQEWDGSSFSGLTQTFASALRRGAFAPPPLPLVILGIVVYVVVVGPLDWFVLKRLRKERLTTLTFLGAVVAFTTLAFGASLLLFSSGARVNRIVVADLAESGSEGRQVLRTMDIAAFYSPRGEDQPVAYTSPAVLLNGSFPGLGFGGDIGSTLPVTILPGDPIRPEAVVQLPFRSQRVVRGHSVGTLGPTIEVEWTSDIGKPAVRVTNGLSVDLTEVFVYVDPTHAYELGPVASGAKTDGGQFNGKGMLNLRKRAPLHEFGWGGGMAWGARDDVSPEQMRRVLEVVTLASYTNDGQPETLQRAKDDEGAVLRKLGLRRDAAFARGNALVVAFASASPVPLPGSSVGGDVHLVIRKEVPKR